MAAYFSTDEGKYGRLPKGPLLRWPVVAEPPSLYAMAFAALFGLELEYTALSRVKSQGASLSH